eukprot:1845000-Lingulodinium_polyedra.AAC.1
MWAAIAVAVAAATRVGANPEVLPGRGRALHAHLLRKLADGQGHAADLQAAAFAAKRDGAR